MARKGDPKPKFDYDAPRFYEVIEDMAAKGLTDQDIAWGLVSEFGQNLNPRYFNQLKNEKGEDGELTVRASKISEALSRGRAKINLAVRSAFLKSALGGRKVKTVSVVSKRIRTEDGRETGGVELQTTETETELAPNFQAQSTWLFNHDQEWRQKVIEGKKLDVTTNGKEIGGTIEIIDKTGLLG